MATSSDPTVAELGERELLARILSRLPKPRVPLGPGDDAAVLAAPDGQLVVTTDTMIEGADFRRDWSTPQQLGWKAMVSNLADVAAMGAEPIGVVIALALPGSTRERFVTGFADGAAAALRKHAPDCGIVGGDLATASEVVVAVTAFGSLCGRDAVVRSGARPGDALAVSGALGRAAAGLTLLQRLGPHHDNPAARALVTAQLAPDPDLTAGERAAAAGATAMMDLSDGPLLDADRLARASTVRIDLEPGRFADDRAQLAADLARLLRLDTDAAGALALELQLAGGEEHTMLASFPSDVALPSGFTRIGTVRAGEPGVAVDGAATEPRGWDPFAAG